MPTLLLVDNGSKKAEATLCLRELAIKLGVQTGKHIHAVSLQHADAIDKTEINDLPAETFHHFLLQHLQQGEREFIVIPLFFGESRALTSFIPQQVTELEKEFGSFKFKVADVIYPINKGEPRLADILYDQIQSISNNNNLQTDTVVIVDHGSPVPEITEVRKQVAKRLQTLLGSSFLLEQAVMERREGSDYDFNGELLENLLSEQAKQGVKSIIVAMMFFLPGRHAGECGDVEKICERVIKKFPEIAVTITPLINEHETLVAILQDRLLDVW